MPAIYTSSTFAQESPGIHKGYEYSRSHNLTRFSFERAVASLENTGLTEEQDTTCGGFAFASGLAATATCLEMLDSGDCLLAMDDMYGGTYRLMSMVRERSQGIRPVYVDMSDFTAVESAFKEHRPAWYGSSLRPIPPRRCRTWPASRGSPRTTGRSRSRTTPSAPSCSVCSTSACTS